MFKMSVKIYLHLLFFCGISCQEIFATFPDKDTKLSTDFLVRKRRVISHLPCGETPTPIKEVNYLVKIRESNRGICAGAILSHYTVITAALCVPHNIKDYKVTSGGSYDYHANVHNVTSKAEYYGNPPHELRDGIALITIDPLFVFTRKTSFIPLQTEPIPINGLATVSGWGYMYPMQRGRATRPSLRTITLHLINHEECRADYQDRIITEKHICTYDRRQYCAQSDEGAPLVVNDKLAGIHVWKGEFPRRKNPDVFINIQRIEYRKWIIENTILI